jgi:hypothetical protein
LPNRENENGVKNSNQDENNSFTGGNINVTLLNGPRIG